MSHPRSSVHPAAADKRRCGERGSASLQAVVVFPALLLIIMTVFQASLFFYSQSAAHMAAQEGVRVTAAKGGTVGGGVDRADGFLHRIAGTLVESPQITGSRTATQATVTVRGRVVSVVPLLHLTVTQTVTLPSEEYSG